MWKVGDVEPVRVMGAEGYPYGFNVTTEDGKPVVSFAYASRALAEAAATHLESALLNAISIHTQNKRRGDSILRWLGRNQAYLERLVRRPCRFVIVSLRCASASEGGMRAFLSGTGTSRFDYAADLWHDAAPLA
jgi:hypothetical protein